VVQQGYSSGALGQSEGGKGEQVAQQTKQQGQQLAQQARQQADEWASLGRDQVKNQLTNQKHQAAQRMTPFQMALRETAQQLRKQGQDPTARYADKASDQIERFSGYLRDTDVDEIADGVRGFARRRPALFLGSAALLGFLGTRFLKSSSQEASSGTGYGSAEPVAALPPVPGETTTMAGQPLGDRDRVEETPPRAGGVRPGPLGTGGDAE